ncbi:MAG TPA: hypothetical protein VF743_00795, partial [Acidimicrobiales bacterium]
MSGCTAPPWQSRLVSADASGTDSGDGASRAPVISPDGRLVAFQSDADDLGPRDTNGVSDLYVRDLAAGTTSLLTVNAAGTDAGNGPSTNVTFGRDGRRVLFASRSTDLALPATSGQVMDLYLRDLATGSTRLVSVDAAGSGGGDGNTTAGELSPVGDRVLFVSDAHDLTTPAGTTTAIFERDMATGVTTKLADGTNAAYAPSGDAVALVRSDGSVVLRDTATGAITSVSAGLPGTATGR